MPFVQIVGKLRAQPRVLELDQAMECSNQSHQPPHQFPRVSNKGWYSIPCLSYLAFFCKIKEIN